jgi:hypothetical protein
VYHHVQLNKIALQGCVSLVSFFLFFYKKQRYLLCRVTRYVCYVGTVSIILEWYEFFLWCHVGSGCVLRNSSWFVMCVTVIVVLKIRSSGTVSDVDW